MLDTLSNVKARLGIMTSQYDAFLTQQITLISDVIEAYLRRKILTSNYTQHFYCTDYRKTPLMQLFCYPVKTITSITEDGVVLDPTCYRPHKPTGSILRTDHHSFFWAKETVVAYSAGLDDCPTPILSVLDSIVQERYNKQVAGIDLNYGADVERIAIPGALSIEYDTSAVANGSSTAFGTILGSQTNVLDPYRSERAILGSSKLIYIDEEPDEVVP